MALNLSIVSEPKKRRVLRQAFRAGFAVALIAITFLALTPAVAAPPRLLGLDKIEHFAAFFALTILARLAWPDVRAWGIGMALVFYGSMIEIAQASPVLMRSASAADLAADMVGIAAGFGALWLWTYAASRYETAPRDAGPFQSGISKTD